MPAGVVEPRVAGDAVQMLSHSVDVRPRRPIPAAVVGGDIVMGLSGYHHSAHMVFRAVARPIYPASVPCARWRSAGLACLRRRWVRGVGPSAPWFL
ncbi:MAG: hypothetical protein ACO2PN_17325 [Pyrobaculum sp.]